MERIFRKGEKQMQVLYTHAEASTRRAHAHNVQPTPSCRSVARRGGRRAHPGLLAEPLDRRDSGDLPSDMFTFASISDIFALGFISSLSFPFSLSFSLTRSLSFTSFFKIPRAKISQVFTARRAIFVQPVLPPRCTTSDLVRE